MEAWEGAGKISGTTRIEGVNTSGVVVDCLHRQSGRIVKTVISGDGGLFQIDGLNSTNVFDVIARPAGKNAVISDSRTPISGGIYYSKWDSERRNTAYTTLDETNLVGGGYNSWLLGSDVPVSSGKWYWELTCNAEGSQRAGLVGICRPTETAWNSAAGTVWGYYAFNGWKYVSNSTGSAYGSIYETGDVVSVLLDLDGGTLSYRLNGVDQGVAFSDLTGSFVACVSGGSSATPYPIFAANFGQSGFLYAPPSGFNSGLYLT